MWKSRLEISGFLCLFSAQLTAFAGQPQGFGDPAQGGYDPSVERSQTKFFWRK